MNQAAAQTPSRLPEIISKYEVEILKDGWTIKRLSFTAPAEAPPTGEPGWEFDTERTPVLVVDEIRPTTICAVQLVRNQSALTLRQLFNDTFGKGPSVAVGVVVQTRTSSGGRRRL